MLSVNFLAPENLNPLDVLEIKYQCFLCRRHTRDSGDFFVLNLFEISFGQHSAEDVT